ncbi:hypothetical protein ACFWWT_41225 [Streptomyces sp. NPDC058676]|uniref:hypothetical protein n=1 Tax=unclassified Streptomyces TaxID=2593676 RepID=UPI003666A3D2
MQSNGTPRYGQHHPSKSNFDIPALPPVPDIEIGKEHRFARLRASWNAAWAEGGFLYHRWDELFAARHAGWHGMANWIKATLALAAMGSLIVLLDTAGDIVTAVLHRVFAAVPAVELPGTDTTSGLWGVIDNPIRSYIGQHSAGLPVPGSAVYAFWQLAGLVGLIGGFARSTGARILWAGWGCSSVAMVWAAAPTGGRTVATGIAALLWALASILALRGLSLRPIVHNHPPVWQPEFRPELHFHAWIPAPAQPGDDTPGNVHQLQQR